MKMLIYAILGITFAILSLTGYTSPFTITGSMTGYALMLHAALAPIFSLIIAAWAVLHASRNRFTENDWRWLFRQDKTQDRISHGLIFGKKICFWLILTMAVPVILSIVSNMFPLIPMHEQVWLLRLHHASVVFLSLGIIGYAGCSWAQMNPENAFR